MTKAIHPVGVAYKVFLAPAQRSLLELRKSYFRPLDFVKRLNRQHISTSQDSPRFNSKRQHGEPRSLETMRLHSLAKRGVLFDSDGQVTLDPIYLRDACRCTRCIDTSTRQREFLFANIPPDIQALPKEQSSNGDWSVTWRSDIPNYDNHTSHYSQDQIRILAGSPDLPDKVFSTVARSLWKKNDLEKRIKPTKFVDFMTSTAGLATVVRDLRRDGLKFITDVPSSATAVGEIAERISPLRNTFYGSTWDVRSVSNANNVAYTNKYLGFHMDLLYMTTPPGYQLLHCIRNSCTGGESRFVDTYKALDIMSVSHPELVRTLSNTYVKFHYENDGHHYKKWSKIVYLRTEKQRSQHILMGAENINLMSRVRSVHWSPPFMGAIEGDRRKTRPFVQASKTFADMLERQDLVFETKMEEGTCVIFDNLRIAHARNAFEMSKGERWLRGAYFDKDDLYSKLRVLSQDIADLESS